MDLHSINDKGINEKKGTLLIAFLVLAFIWFVGITGYSQNREPDKSDIPILKWTGPGQPGSYEEYRREHVDRPLQIRKIDVFTFHSRKQVNHPEVEKKILMLVEDNIYQVLTDKVHRYVYDIHQQGYSVHFFEYTGGNAPALKSFIKSEKQNLLGCVLIGDLPAAWYEVDDDYNSYGYAQFPCDLFYMDLDGKWLDVDGDGMFDRHEDGSGDRQPEIFIGRIDASRMDGPQIELLDGYFDKNHAYWTGNIYLLQFGLTYTEDDWSIYHDIVSDISNLYPGNYLAIKAPATSRSDYFENRLTEMLYEFIQLACHSNSSAHYFTRGGALNSQDIRNGPPQGLAFNLFCCSALRFTDWNCLGGAYIFNAGTKALAVIGSSKTGSMLEFHHFYRALHARNSVGLALKIWFEMIAPYGDDDLFWHYGMTIMGDPLMVLRYNQKDVLPPVDLSVIQIENRSLLLNEHINVLGWNSNPLNNESEITGYRIYRLLEGDLRFLSEVSGEIKEYIHRGIEFGIRYIYGLSSVRYDGLESYPAFVEIFSENH